MVVMLTRTIPSPKLVETPSASYDMVGVARVTMQPTRVPLWLGSSRRVVEDAEAKGMAIIRVLRTHRIVTLFVTSGRRSPTRISGEEVR